MPKVSIIVSVYGCEKYIGETIESIINQTVTDWELIIIDDNSRDDSAKVIQKYADSDARIRFIRNYENKGQCANLNHAIELSTGEYIAHTDHDDISASNRLEKQIKYMEDNPSCVLCGCGFDQFVDEKTVEVDMWPFCGLNELRFTLPFVNQIAHSSFFWKRELFIRKGIFYGQWDYAEDYDFVLRALEIGDVGFVSEKLLKYRVIPNQVTQTIGANVINDETRQIQIDYINKLDLVDKEIWIKAANGRLNSFGDYKRWGSLLAEYARICGVKNELLVKEINKTMLWKQKPGIGRTKACLLNNWKHF